MEPLHSGFTLVVGAELYDGCRLLQGFVRQLCSDGHRRVLLFTEHSDHGTAFLCDSLPDLVAQVARMDDVAEQIFNRNGMFSSMSSFLEFIHSTLKPEPELSRDCAVVIVFDSIAPLVVLFGISKTLQIIRQLTSDSNAAVLAFVASELLEDQQLAQLTFSASLTYRLHVDSMAGVFYAEKCRKLANKVKKELINFHIEEDGSCKIVKRQAKPTLAQSKVSPSMPSGPFSLPVTFNLSVRDEELAVKQSLQLPYIQAQKGDRDGSGNVYYEPDKGDDIDEEDPDNDLEF
ncbi:unnamed protein product [Soboliphyme baturini]|uniref:Elongator complex protein 5 n=1 Tax=Soboliphyme baturini TaxID=241478 RepID=A0A183JB10_9BILA|nr:unnamed protein product [Soboliphyme baturini]